MAREAGKPKSSVTIRRIRTKKDRSSGVSLFTRLKTDEWFKAYALFSPDPELADNPGWFEYVEHYDNSNQMYVPCTGEDCYMCQLGENPSGRALSVWYFPDNSEKEKLKILKANGWMIRDFMEIDDEEGGVLGRRFRVKRLSDRGEYRVTPQADKPLLKRQIKELLSEIPDLEAMMTKQAEQAIKKAHAVAALSEDDDDTDDDDDEDEDEEQPKARRGKPKVKAEEPEEEEDEDDEEEEEEEDDEDEEDENDEEDETDDEDEEEDEDEEDDEDDEDADEDEEDEDSASLNGEKFVVVSVSEKDETITVKVDGKNTKLWLGEGVEADWDVVKKGTEIIVDAVKDSEGDLVVTSLTAKKPRAPRRAASK